MTEVIIAKNGDRIERILVERGVRRHELQPWYTKLRRINPHIGNMERIWPGDRLLVPDRLGEHVSDYLIWENSFSGIPQSLRYPWNGNMIICLSGIGDTIDNMAQRAFKETSHSTLSPNIQRAVFLANNPRARLNLPDNHLPFFQSFVCAPAMLNGFDARFWQNETQLFGYWLNQLDPATQGLFQDAGPQETYLLAKMVEWILEAGGSAGPEDLVRGASYGAAGVSGHAATGQMLLSKVYYMARQIYDDAVKQVGLKVATSKKDFHLRQLNQIINKHPSFPNLNATPQRTPGPYAARPSSQACAASRHQHHSKPHRTALSQTILPGLSEPIIGPVHEHHR